MSWKLSLDLQSLFLALLIHIIIAKLFVFSIPFQKITDRPEMTFWGSFLSSIDHPFPVQNTSIENPANIAVASYYQSSTYDQKPIKPSVKYSDYSINDNKKFQKTTFLHETPPASAYGYPQNKKYQNTKIEYQPLRFQPYLP